MKVTDQVAIVTGGGSGIGKATCLLFSQKGAKVVVADVSLERAEEVASIITDQGGTAIALKVDVADRSSVDEMVATVINEFGRIDILINNAGIIQDAQLTEMTIEQWNKVIDINLTGVFHCTQAVVPFMKEQEYGRIINMSSIVKDGNFGQTNYSATKAGVVAMTKTWAKELGKYKINVNAVAGGFIRTPMTASMPEKVLTMMEKKVPLKRLGEPEDIAKAYLFFASEYADYVNGAVLGVDGGLTI